MFGCLFARYGNVYILIFVLFGMVGVGDKTFRMMGNSWIFGYSLLLVIIIGWMGWLGWFIFSFSSYKMPLILGYFIYLLVAFVLFLFSFRLSTPRKFLLLGASGLIIIKNLIAVYTVVNSASVNPLIYNLFNPASILEIVAFLLLLYYCGGHKK